MIRASMSSTVPAHCAHHWGKPYLAPGIKRGSASRFRRASLGKTRRSPRRLTRSAGKPRDPLRRYPRSWSVTGREQRERLRGGELDAKNGLAAREEHGHNAGGTERRRYRAQAGPQGPQVRRADRASGLIALGQVREPERDGRVGTGPEVPEVQDVDGVP